MKVKIWGMGDLAGVARGRFDDDAARFVTVHMPLISLPAARGRLLLTRLCDS